jgi:hypothetical protein
MPEPEGTPEATPAAEPQSVSVQTPNTIATANPQSQPDPTKTPDQTAVDFTSVIPEAYKGKPYMKEVDSFDKLFADFDNAQTLIGQRQQSAEIPGADATPEQIQAYADKIRPESPDVYTFPETEYSKKFGRDEAFQGEMKTAFQEAALQPWQVNILTEKYDAALFGKASELAASAETQAADFEKLADGHFGESKEEKLKIANAVLKENTPEAFKPFLEKLPNESLMILSAVANELHAKYMTEDNLNIGAKGTATDEGALQEEARQLMADPSYKDFRHPNHDRTVKRVNELYDQIGSIKK